MKALYNWYSAMLENDSNDENTSKYRPVPPPKQQVGEQLLIHEFNSITSCPKCLGGSKRDYRGSLEFPVSRGYHNPSVQSKFDSYNPSGLDCEGRTPPLEHMHVRCNQCNYSWLEWTYQDNSAIVKELEKRLQM